MHEHPVESDSRQDRLKRIKNGTDYMGGGHRPSLTSDELAWYQPILPEYGQAANILIYPGIYIYCLTCEHEYFPELPKPGWWACPCGCTDAFRQQQPDLAAELDREWPWDPLKPPVLPWPSSFYPAALVRESLRTALEVPFGIRVCDFDARIIQCIQQNCDAVWEAKWKVEPGHVTMPGWWRCPKGCNAWCERPFAYAATIAKMEVRPPWDPPPDLLTAACSSTDARTADDEPQQADPSCCVVADSTPNSSLDDLRQRARALLSERTGMRKPAIAKLADVFGVSESTLRRHIRDCLRYPHGPASLFD